MDGINEEMLRARREAAHRRRPLIVDDDGDLVYDPRTPDGPEAFTRLRHTDLVDAGVDSLAWCIMWAIAQGTADSVRYWQTQQRGTPFQVNMPDPTPVVAEFCRRHGIEVFGSIRMNDCHDAFGMPSPSLLYPLKVEHPEYLVGHEGQRGGVEDGLVSAMWSGLDYALPEVREDRLWWIEHTATTYNLDGVDLNFFRMPWVFKLGAEAENVPVMTEFIRRARRIVDAASVRRQRPVLLGVRVHDTVETCLRTGMDVETWLKEGLIDRVLAGGGYASFCVPADELVDLGHRYDVPVYPCINCPGTFDCGAGNGFEALRGAAANFWEAGADGIYLWNYQYLRTPHIAYGQPYPEEYAHLADLADPARLRRLDKVFSVNPRPLEQYARASAPCPLPLGLDQERRSLSVRIGEDVSSASRLQLQLDLENTVPGDRLDIRFNDLELDGGDGGSVEAPLTADAIRRGENELAVSVVERGATASKSLELTGARVRVSYEG